MEETDNTEDNTVWFVQTPFSACRKFNKLPAVMRTVTSKTPVLQQLCTVFSVSVLSAWTYTVCASSITEVRGGHQVPWSWSCGCECHVGVGNRTWVCRSSQCSPPGAVSPAPGKYFVFVTSRRFNWEFIEIEGLKNAPNYMKMFLWKRVMTLQRIIAAE